MAATCTTGWFSLPSGAASMPGGRPCASTFGGVGASGGRHSGGPAGGGEGGARGGGAGGGLRFNLRRSGGEGRPLQRWLRGGARSRGRGGGGGPAAAIEGHAARALPVVRLRRPGRGGAAQPARTRGLQCVPMGRRSRRELCAAQPRPRREPLGGRRRYHVRRGRRGASPRSGRPSDAAEGHGAHGTGRSARRDLPYRRACRLTAKKGSGGMACSRHRARPRGPRPLWAMGGVGLFVAVV